MKRLFMPANSNVKTAARRLSRWSVGRALTENGLSGLVNTLRKIVPDISGQEPREKEALNDCVGLNDYIELKRRALQAFQCSLMLKALEGFPRGALTVVDIGDSAGTHMLYLKELVKDKFDIDTISVNLDRERVKEVEAKGLKAIHYRAENLDLEGKQVDLFTSFQMVEHLHNPAIFFRRLAKKSDSNRILLTVPYLRKSRVGLHHIRNDLGRIINAGDEHIFELSPEDWTLLMLHSGWKVVHSEVYYQYPRRWPFVTQVLSLYWRLTDFEGFWGAILEKDTTFSDYYQDWED